MGVAILDPRTHDGMHVDANFRGHVEAVIETEADHACLSGYKFNINTGDITLTSAAKTTVLYVKNTSEYDLACSAFIYNLGNSNVSAGDSVISLYRNPTAGDIITNANNVLAGTGVEANLNFGSSQVLSGSFFKGATGETAVSGGDGVAVTTRYSSQKGRIFIDLGNLIIPQGKSIAVDYTPPASNTSQICQFAISCHIRHPSVAAA